MSTPQKSPSPASTPTLTRVVTITTPTLQRAQLSPLISAVNIRATPELISSPSCSTSRNHHHRQSFNRCSLSSATSSSSSSKESSPSSPPSNAKHSYSFHTNHNQEASATISSQSSAFSTTPSCSTLGSSAAPHNHRASFHRSPTLDNSLPPPYERIVINLFDDDDEHDDEEHEEFIIDYQRSQTVTENEQIMQQYLPPPSPVASTSSSPRLQVRNGQRTVSTDSALAIEQTGANSRRIGHRRVNTDGEVTYKKIQSTQIMYSIQLGIGYMVGSLASKPERDLLMQDFMQIETIYFPKTGSQVTPAHHYTDFRFSTYTPTAFRYFRDLFGIQPDDFMLSINHDAMQELSNPGASGSVFYRTYDDKFIIKTVQRTEAKFLLKLLPGYFMNLSQNQAKTLLPKFFGLYIYECVGQNIRLLVMNNLLPSCIKMHQKYDLKGSTYRRKASPQELQKESPVFKDLDFLDHYDLMDDFQHHQDNPNNLPLQEQQQQQKSNNISNVRSGSGSSSDSFPMSNLLNTNGTGALRLEAKVYDETMTSLEKDCRVLESFEIMDYSLLIGVHNYDQARIEYSQTMVDSDGQLGPVRPYFDYDDDNQLPTGAIRARNHKGERLLLFIGIIDILQSYRLTKKFEHAWKSFLHDGDTISVHKPSFYKYRFMDFMRRYVFRKIPAPQSAISSTATISMEQIHELRRPKRRFHLRNIFRKI